MKPSHVAHAVRTCLQINQPLMIWGPPGVGKSSVVAQEVKAMGRNLIDLRLSLLDSVDLRGFPYKDENNRMLFAVPGFFPTDPEADDVILIDEINKGTQATMAATYQLILDRALGEYKVPPKVSFIAAGNNEDDACYVETMPSALAGRFTHVDYEVDFEDWKKHALSSNYCPEIVNFISFRPALLHAFDSEKRISPMPRGWEYSDKIMKSGDQDQSLIRSLIAGSVGEGAAAEFSSFLNIYQNLPDPDEVLRNPMAAFVPEDTQTCYALCGALAARAGKKNFASLITYCKRLLPEFQVMTVRDAVTRDRSLANTPEFGEWAVENADVIM